MNRRASLVEHLAGVLLLELRALGRRAGPATAMRHIEETPTLRRRIPEELRERVVARAMTMQKMDFQPEEETVATKAERMEIWLMGRFAEGEQDPAQLHRELPADLGGMTLGSFRASYFYPVLKEFRRCFEGEERGAEPARNSAPPSRPSTAEPEGDVLVDSPEGPMPSMKGVIEGMDVGTRISLCGPHGSFSASHAGGGEGERPWSVRVELVADAETVDQLLGHFYPQLTGLGRA